MQITEQELREMIRTAIAGRAGGGEAHAPQIPVEHAGAVLHLHSSHGLFLVAGTPDGDCVIEPNRRCDHCGYCKSLGH